MEPESPGQPPGEPPASGETESLRERITRLRSELADLENQAGGSRWKRKSWQILKRIGMFCLSYWALTSFLAALATATYVKFAYGIDYFESYRNASAVKRLSQFHERMGDEMFQQLNWKEAVASYRKATQVNASNISAALGETKSSVLLPAGEATMYDPDVADARLKILHELYPDDAQVLTLLALRAFDAGDRARAISGLDTCLAKHPGFTTGYVLKGFIQHDLNLFDEAVATMKKATELDPANATAHSNLAWTLLLLGKREEATGHSEAAFAINPSLIISLVRGELMRLEGDASGASNLFAPYHAMAENPAAEKEPVWGGLWTLNHLPLAEGDRETIMRRTYCQNLDQKKAMVAIHYGVALGQAGDTVQARDLLASALAKAPEQRAFLVNKLRATFLCKVLGDDAAAWMASEADYWESQPVP
jgi:tetratricopeptide (TPR) repeat protein